MFYTEFKEKRGILITGSSGVGKTTLVQKAFSVKKVLPLTENGKPASTTKVIDYSGKLGEDALVFTDTPGDQLAKKILIEDGLIPRVDGGQIQGIVNVVAGGFSCISSTEDEVEFTEEYKKSKISDDVNYLSSLLSNVNAIDEDVWFITVVNKKDLWQGSLDIQSTYGSTSDYGKVLRGKNGPQGQVYDVSTACYGEEDFEELEYALRKNVRVRGDGSDK